MSDPNGGWDPITAFDVLIAQSANPVSPTTPAVIAHIPSSTGLSSIHNAANAHTAMVSRPSGPGTKRRRLTKEGYDILDSAHPSMCRVSSDPVLMTALQSCWISTDYFYHVSPSPNEGERAALAAQIARLPGCEFYTTQQVYTWFANTRHNRRKPHPRERLSPQAFDGIFEAAAAAIAKRVAETRAWDTSGERLYATRPSGAAQAQEQYTGQLPDCVANPPGEPSPATGGTPSANTRKRKRRQTSPENRLPDPRQSSCSLFSRLYFTSAPGGIKADTTRI